MIEIGRIIGSEVATNRDSDEPVRLLQVELTALDDVQSVELFTQAGDDNNPPDDAMCMVLTVSDALKIIVAVSDGLEPEVERGERELYSQENGEKKARFKLQKDGKIIHNEGDRLVARKEDEITITPDTDPEFFVFMNGLATLLGKDPILSVTGKVAEGTDKVLTP
jgi:phage gp45-like